MLVIASAEHPKKPGQSDAAFWADLLNEEDGDNAIIVPSTVADDDGDGPEGDAAEEDGAGA